MPVILAHGALGIFDELLFLGVAVIFLVMMVISWMKSRYSQLPPTQPDEQPTPADPDKPGHFKLD